MFIIWIQVHNVEHVALSLDLYGKKFDAVEYLETKSKIRY